MSDALVQALHYLCKLYGVELAPARSHCWVDAPAHWRNYEAHLFAVRLAWACEDKAREAHGPASPEVEEARYVVAYLEGEVHKLRLVGPRG